MSDLRKGDVALIFVADIHLSHKAPAARTHEPSWYDAMARPLNTLRELSAVTEAPVIYAGDIFDRWNAPPELVNFAMRFLPRGYGVPGNHDLPGHSYTNLYRSAYGVLVTSGIITTLPTIDAERAGQIQRIGDAYVVGFPVGFDVIPFTEAWETQNGKRDRGDLPAVAVVHDYIWNDARTSFPGASPDAKSGRYAKRLAGYTHAVFGDNHKRFTNVFTNGLQLANCGGLMRRKIDERAYDPAITVLTTDGCLRQFKLDTSADVFTVNGAAAAKAVSGELRSFTDYLETLGSLKDAPLDFEDAVRNYFESHDVSDLTKSVLIEAMGS